MKRTDKSLLGGNDKIDGGSQNCTGGKNCHPKPHIPLKPETVAKPTIP
ncbi:MAG: hypothetical protein AAB783_00395 [Patescibacteria group bacterium]